MSSLSPAMRFAFLMNAILPRGKGLVPRKIGGYIKNNSAEYYISTRHGAKLFIDPTSLDIYATIANNKGVWDWSALVGSAVLLSPGDVFYDIGANVGYITLEIAKLFEGYKDKSSLKIISFEALPTLAKAIRASAELSHVNNVRVFEGIVSDAEGECEIYIGSHSIHASTQAREPNSTVIKLPAFTLDHLVQTGELPAPNVIKIDVEGGELAAFRGAENTIRQYSPQIIFESDQNTQRFNYSRQDLFDFLTNCSNYRFYECTAHTGLIRPIYHTFDAILEPQNIIATTKSDEEISEYINKTNSWASTGLIKVS